jgi:hypothetical protein
MAKEAEVAQKFLAEVLNHKEVGCSRTSTSRSTAWASMKSFRAKDGSDEPPAGGRNGERDDLGSDLTQRSGKFSFRRTPMSVSSLFPCEAGVALGAIAMRAQC